MFNCGKVHISKHFKDPSICDAFEKMKCGIMCMKQNVRISRFKWHLEVQLTKIKIHICNMILKNNYVDAQLQIYKDDFKIAHTNLMYEIIYVIYDFYTETSSWVLLVQF